jgi:mRNA interferase RelE/StbE
MSHQAREMIAAALVALAGNPRPSGCVKLAGADDLWRIRVRQYRVVYQILDDQLIITVVKIGDRKDVYR